MCNDYVYVALLSGVLLLVSNATIDSHDFSYSHSYDIYVHLAETLPVRYLLTTNNIWYLVLYNTRLHVRVVVLPAWLPAHAAKIRLQYSQNHEEQTQHAPSP